MSFLVSISTLIFSVIQRCAPFAMAARVAMFNEMHGLYGQKPWFQA